MSVSVLRLVMNGFRTGGAEKLIMLVLADLCDDKGGNLYPSMAYIAERAVLSESQTRRVVHRLADAGWLAVVGNHTGGAPGSTRHYEINVGKLRAGASASPTPGAGDTPTASADATRTPGASARAGVDARAGAGAREGWRGCASTPGAHDTQPVIDPLLPVMNTAEAAASDAGASPVPLSDKDRVWSFGPSLLGGTEKSAKGLLGKLVKEHGEAVVAEVLAACAKEDPGEPKAWVVKACMQRRDDAKRRAGISVYSGGDALPAWAAKAGFTNRWEAENAGCFEHNAHQFAGGHEVTA